MSTYVAVLALLFAYVALVAAYVALRTLAKLRTATRILARGTRGPQAQESLMEATQRHAELTVETRADLAALKDQVALLQAETAALTAASPTEVVAAADPNGALRNLALVRYDAFTGMSGRMSFSLALLDEHGDGITLSAIAGQSDTRVYAKGVTGGSGEHDLSPEEGQAVRAALKQRRVKPRRKSA